MNSSKQYQQHRGGRPLEREEQQGQHISLWWCPIPLAPCRHLKGYFGIQREDWRCPNGRYAATLKFVLAVVQYLHVISSPRATSSKVRHLAGPKYTVDSCQTCFDTWDPPPLPNVTSWWPSTADHTERKTRQCLQSLSEMPISERPMRFHDRPKPPFVINPCYHQTRGEPFDLFMDRNTPAPLPPQWCYV